MNASKAETSSFNPSDAEAEGKGGEGIPDVVESSGGGSSNGDSDGYVDVGASCTDRDEVEVEVEGTTVEDSATGSVDATDSGGLRRRVRAGGQGGAEGDEKGAGAGSDGGVAAGAGDAAVEGDQLANDAPSTGGAAAGEAAVGAGAIPHPGRLPDNIYDNGVWEVSERTRAPTRKRKWLPSFFFFTPDFLTKEILIR